jgi:hypothetical protein
MPVHKTGWRLQFLMRALTSVPAAISNRAITAKSLLYVV